MRIALLVIVFIFQWCNDPCFSLDGGSNVDQKLDQALFFEQRNRFDEAKREIEQAKALSPTSESIRLLLARVEHKHLKKSGRINEANSLCLKLTGVRLDDLPAEDFSTLTGSDKLFLSKEEVEKQNFYEIRIRRLPPNAFLWSEAGASSSYFLRLAQQLEQEKNQLDRSFVSAKEAFLLSGGHPGASTEVVFARITKKYAKSLIRTKKSEQAKKCMSQFLATRCKTGREEILQLLASCK